jgi:hypothetical protein
MIESRFVKIQHLSLLIFVSCLWVQMPLVPWCCFDDTQCDKSLIDSQETIVSTGYVPIYNVYTYSICSLWFQLV